MTESAARILLVEPPSAFRDELARAVVERGAQAHTLDDGFEALAELRGLSPNVVVVGDGAGPPGPDSLCRILQRTFTEARVVKLADSRALHLGGDVHPVVSRGLPADEVAARILFGAAPDDARVLQLRTGALQAGQLLFALLRIRATGQLYVQTEDCEWRFSLAWGLPVESRGGVLADRLGAVLLERGALTEATLLSAVDQARESGLRLGEALRKTGAIDGAALFDVLHEQHRRRVGGVCLAGPAVVRFVPTALRDLLARTPAQPVHPLGGLLAAVSRLSADMRTAALARLAERELLRGAGLDEARRVLTAVGLREVADQLPGIASVGALGQALSAHRSVCGSHAPESWALALVAAGCVVLGRGGAGASMPPHSQDPLRSLSSLSSLELDWTSAGPPEPSADDQRRLEGLFFGVAVAAEATEGARRAWLDGPLSSALPDSRAAALYLDTLAGSPPHGVIGASPSHSPTALQLAYHRRLDEIDRLFPADATQPERVFMRGQLRAACSVVAGMLPATDPSEPGDEWDVEPIEVPSAAPPPVPDPGSENVARAPLSIGAKPPPPPPPGDPALPPLASLGLPPANRQQDSDPAATGLPGEVESLVQQGRWVDLMAWVDAQPGARDGQPPGVLLLYAIACKEAGESDADVPDSPDAVGIRSVSRLLGVGADSPSAIVVAKRALRQRPQPGQIESVGKRLALLPVVIALLVGAVVGLLTRGFAP